MLTDTIWNNRKFLEALCLPNSNGEEEMKIDFFFFCWECGSQIDQEGACGFTPTLILFNKYL